MSAVKEQQNPETIHITIACQVEPGRHPFEVSPQLTVGEFLQQVLDELARSDDGERVKTLLECYEPVLELQGVGEEAALANDLPLQQAGVTDGAICRIAGTPRKEKIMFCRHS